MILVFTIDHEYSTSKVLTWLDRMGEEVIRLNADDDRYKFEYIDESGIFFRNRFTNKIVNLSDAKSCWWRRRGISERCFFTNERRKFLIADKFDLTKLINGSLKNDIFNNESSRLIEYIYSRLYQTCSINLGRPPLFNLNKLILLEIAKKNGLKTAPFRIVTNKTNILTATELNGENITKAISNGVMEQLEDSRYYTYTELLDSDFLLTESEVRFFPSLISAKIDKLFEIRSFFIDGVFYSMAIYSQRDSQTSIDFRKYNYSNPNRTEPYKLPKEIEKKLINVFEDIKLNCGSIDLIFDKDGNYIFLEINPVGQYNMVSDPCNYNLDKIIANFLVYGKHEIN